MNKTSAAALQNTLDKDSLPDKNGRFGPYGGSYVPETLFYPLRELEAAYKKAKGDQSFKDELNGFLKEFEGRPTELYYAERYLKNWWCKDFLEARRFITYGCPQN